MCAARSASCRPASVKAKRRDERLISRPPSRASILLTALETVAFESLSSAAAPAKERISTTFAKIAMPSKSGNLAMMLDSETMCFQGFYFLAGGLSIGCRADGTAAAPESADDRTSTIQQARGRRSRLAEGQAPLFLC